MLIGENPDEWEAMLPYCECILRATPIDAVGGRSPYQVVTGLLLRLPRTLTVDSSVIQVGLNAYVDNLMSYLKDTYRCVKNHQIAVRERRDIEAKDEGTLGCELQVGDLVMLRLDPINKRGGATRFKPRVREDMWRIKAKISPQTFKLCSPDDPSFLYDGTMSADNLIRIELPQIELESALRGLIEIKHPSRGAWERFRAEKMAADGKVYLTHSP
jgi:hypothetical protein